MAICPEDCGVVLQEESQYGPTREAVRNNYADLALLSRLTREYVQSNPWSVRSAISRVGPVEIRWQLTDAIVARPVFATAVLSGSAHFTCL